MDFMFFMNHTVCGLAKFMLGDGTVFPLCRRDPAPMLQKQKI